MTKATSKLPTKQSNLAMLGDMLESRKAKIMDNLPDGSTEREFQKLKQTMLFAFVQNEGLQRCTVESQLQATYDVASTGLDITSKIQKHGYLVARGSTCCFDLSYHGMIYLAVKMGIVKRMRVGIVREGDTAKVTQDNEGCDDLVVTATLGNDAPPTAYFARFVLQDGQVIISHMSKAQVEEHRNKYAQAKGEGSPWVKAFDQMALKTVIKQPFLRGEIVIKDERFKRMLDMDVDDGEGPLLDVPQETRPEPIPSDLFEKGGESYE